MITNGVSCSYDMKIEDKDGYLVYAEKTRKVKLFNKYDKWRSSVCHKYRHTKRLKLSFRQGRLDIFTLIYALNIKLFWR